MGRSERLFDLVGKNIYPADLNKWNGWYNFTSFNTWVFYNKGIPIVIMYFKDKGLGRAL